MPPDWMDTGNTCIIRGLWAGLPVQVPLLMAINLKQGQKCRVMPPDWMDTGNTWSRIWLPCDSSYQIVIQDLAEVIL